MQTEYPYTGLKPRLAALGLDFLIIAAYAVILFVAATTLILTTSVEQRLNSALARDFVAFVNLILPAILYFSLQESSARLATIGKQKVELNILLDKRHRAPFDWLAGSAVIRVDRASERDENPPY